MHWTKVISLLLFIFIQNFTIPSFLLFHIVIYDRIIASVHSNKLNWFICGKDWTRFQFIHCLWKESASSILSSFYFLHFGCTWLIWWNFIFNIKMKTIVPMMKDATNDESNFLHESHFDDDFWFNLCGSFLIVW